MQSVPSISGESPSVSGNAETGLNSSRKTCYCGSLHILIHRFHCPPYPQAGVIPPIYGYKHVQPGGGYTPFLGLHVYPPGSSIMQSVNEPPSPLMGSPVGTPTAMMFPQTPFAGAHHNAAAAAHYGAIGMPHYGGGAGGGNPFASDPVMGSPQHSGHHNYFHPIFNSYHPATLSPQNSYAGKNGNDGRTSRHGSNSTLRRPSSGSINAPPDAGGYYQDWYAQHPPGMYTPSHSRSSSRSWGRMSGLPSMDDVPTSNGAPPSQESKAADGGAASGGGAASMGFAPSPASSSAAFGNGGRRSAASPPVSSAPGSGRAPYLPACPDCSLLSFALSSGRGIVVLHGGVLFPIHLCAPSCLRCLQTEQCTRCNLAVTPGCLSSVPCTIRMATATTKCT